MVASLVRTIEAVPETGRAQLLIDQVAALPVSGVPDDQQASAHRLLGRLVHTARWVPARKGSFPWGCQPL